MRETAATPSRIRRRLRTSAGALLLAATLGGCAADGTGLGLNLVSQDQLAGMGEKAWVQQVRETPQSRNATYQRAARQVSDRLLRAAGQDPGDWEVRVFAAPQANAFALPGNKIGVYEGLFRHARNEDQLAAVIGHEIAHNLQEHAAERVSTQMVTEAGSQLLGTALGVAGVGGGEAAAALLGAGAQYGLILPYSRNQELEADRIGLLIMARAGYDPRAAVELWQNMSAEGGRPPEFMSTHPGTENRIRQLEEFMPQALAEYRQR